jgi:hypothetical protein
LKYVLLSSGYLTSLLSDAAIVGFIKLRIIGSEIGLSCVAAAAAVVVAAAAAAVIVVV